MSWAQCITHHGVVASTMDEMRHAADAGALHGESVCARAQSAARGRRGRQWLAPVDHGAYVTTLLRPGPQVGLERLSIVAGAAVYEALTHLGARVQLKWPNDIMANGRKLAGILLEADNLGTDAPRVFVGVGVNLAAAASITWPDGLRAPPVGLADLVAEVPSVRAVVAAIVTRLEAHVHAWETRGVGPALAVWRQADVLHGQAVQVQSDGAPLIGEACGVDDDGRLLVRGESGVVRVGAGEVTMVRPMARAGVS